jgi:putative IMPACT (imprinted ancient) family translation regulator
LSGLADIHVALRSFVLETVAVGVADTRVAAAFDEHYHQSGIPATAAADIHVPAAFDGRRLSCTPAIVAVAFDGWHLSFAPVVAAVAAAAEPDHSFVAVGIQFGPHN